MNHLVIMAGGIGSRFWPMSTPEKPKQFIDVLGTGRSLLQMTVDRFAGICPISQVWVVTSVRYQQLVKSQLPEIPDTNILLEPCMRNTAPCIAYVAWKIKQKDPEANLVISASDHVVMDVTEFKRVIRKGLEFVDREDRILTLGMFPTRPETGYGYIHTESRGDMEGEIQKVEGFKEKPDLKTARHYLQQGGYYWNAGIFLWNIKTIEKAFRKYQLEMAGVFDSLNEFYYTASEQTEIDKKFPECKNISIDYAIMEHASNIYVFPADFGWSDLGTWGSLYEQLPRDKSDNALVGGKICMVESAGCIVHISGNKKILVQGLEDYIIAEQDDVILICKKSDEQRIKEFSAKL